ncbi:MAG TPA: DnaD domain-containing protein [Bacillota bacterium]|nr:DnaD domain-containing protein [Bacillota bacterium]
MAKWNEIQQIVFNQISVPEKILTDYSSLGLDEKEVMVILHLLRFLKQQNDFPTPKEIVQHMTIDEKECTMILRKLIQKGMLSIQQKENEANQLSESYSLNPLFEKLFAEKEEMAEDAEGTIFILFEQEFGRPLSPFEIEMVNTWLDEDKIIPALIKAALREAVLMGKLNFKYIDRILREWKKKGIHTVEQARNAARNFHQSYSGPALKKQTKRDTSIYYNWLEGEE